VPNPVRPGREPSEDFDYEAVERALGESVDDHFEDLITGVAEADDAMLMKVPAIRNLVARSLERVIRRLRADDRAPLAMDTLVIALGGGLKPDGTTLSMTEVGTDHGVTKAAVSKRVRHWRVFFHLPSNRYLKSDASRSKYALTNASPIRLGDRPARGRHPA
jgi:hypothetical protein